MNGVTDKGGVGLGTTVVARCKEGFKFPNNNLTMVLECVDLGGTLHTLSWNDTLPDCQRE